MRASRSVASASSSFFSALIGGRRSETSGDSGWASQVAARSAPSAPTTCAIPTDDFPDPCLMRPPFLVPNQRLGGQGCDCPQHHAHDRDANCQPQGSRFRPCGWATLVRDGDQKLIEQCEAGAASGPRSRIAPVIAFGRLHTLEDRHAPVGRAFSGLDQQLDVLQERTRLGIARMVEREQQG